MTPSIVKPSLLLIATALLLAACTVRAPQLDMARQAAPERGSAIDVEQFAWQMTFNDTEARLYAITVGNGIIFANEHGLEVAFDGWDVVIVSGLPGTLGMIRIDKSTNPRVHHVQGLDQAFEVDCEPPMQAGGGWRQRCQHRSDGRVFAMNHAIDVNSQGRITRIEAALIPGVGPLVLTPLFDIGE